MIEKKLTENKLWIHVLVTKYTTTKKDESETISDNKEILEKLIDFFRACCKNLNIPQYEDPSDITDYVEDPILKSGEAIKISKLGNQLKVAIEQYPFLLS